MVLALERTLEGDPGKTLDSVQKERSLLFHIAFNWCFKVFFRGEKKQNKHTFQKYSFHTVKKKMGQ